MTKIDALHRRWRKDADYEDAYHALGEELDLARSLIETRTAARLSQSPLAKKMKTSVLHRAHRERKMRPSTDARERFAGLERSEPNFRELEPHRRLACRARGTSASRRDRVRKSSNPYCSSDSSPSESFERST